MQNYLKWVEQKSSSVEAPYKASAIRAFYFTLDQYLIFDLSLSLEISFNLNLIDLFLIRFVVIDLAVNLMLTLNLDSIQRLKLQEWKTQLPDIFKENIDNLKKWWKINGETWAQQIYPLIFEYRNIGYDWQFTENQKKLLQQYYSANYLLVDCLKECHLTRAVREEIEDTLLLPVQRN